jgi:hypothetical protein
MSKYSKYFFENKVDYGQGTYYDVGYYGPNVWWKGEKYGTKFTNLVLRFEEDMAMEEDTHTHDFDMYLFFVPADPNDMENLGCTIEFSYGEQGEQETYISDKICSFYVPAHMPHGPLLIKNLKKPCYLIHSTMAGNYETWREGKDSREERALGK